MLDEDGVPKGMRAVLEERRSRHNGNAGEANIIIIVAFSRDTRQCTEKSSFGYSRLYLLCTLTSVHTCTCMRIHYITLWHTC